MKMLRMLAAGAAIFLAGTMAGLAGESYPARPISLVVPFAPGGGSDPLARGIGERLTQALGQPVVVEYKPGANALIAEGYTARAAPDGYTILLDTTALALNRARQAKASFDLKKDLTPVIMPAWAPHVVIVRADSPHHNTGSLISAMRAAPGKFTYGSFGAGSTSHLAGVLLDSMAGAKSIHVPYRGGAPAIQGLLAGDIDIVYGTVPLAMPFIKSGQLKALAVTSRHRIPELPDTPAMAETLPDYEINLWWALLAPSGTPRPVIDKLNAAVTQAVRSAELRKRLAPQGYNFTDGPPEEVAAFIAAEEEKWGSLIKSEGIALN
ncbi:Bug family tripartite tricarboxylate transporter substrate binding protein [Pollutimonas bauzanensis]|uniref:Tripartite-type tricarboxylate transporter, receptor component TctC n=1 Tax=Pollutimonas bauzanensis TaxID=658167 RepID=A0A1M5M0V9_9BURK|nr:tripartite tricarboxylate transporter substrate binding protein [Pollutimonas bauzanensis]SHG70539.1 Tripartite-type tricarboxylate transporter, receptor component TctC [Pollutimonas bauzanensis]